MPRLLPGFGPTASKGRDAELETDRGARFDVASPRQQDQEREPRQLLLPGRAHLQELHGRPGSRHPQIWQQDLCDEVYFGEGWWSLVRWSRTDQKWVLPPPVNRLQLRHETWGHLWLQQPFADNFWGNGRRLTWSHHNELSYSLQWGLLPVQFIHGGKRPASAARLKCNPPRYQVRQYIEQEDWGDPHHRPRMLSAPSQSISLQEHTGDRYRQLGSSGDYQRSCLLKRNRYMVVWMFCTRAGVRRATLQEYTWAKLINFRSHYRIVSTSYPIKMVQWIQRPHPAVSVEG